MGVKGDRAAKEPQAIRMYINGHSLAEISRQLDISDTTLRRWKEESRVPGNDIDGWDNIQYHKQSVTQTIKKKKRFTKNISWAIRKEAADLYIIEGLSYAEVYIETGVSDTTLRRWGKADLWNERRERFRQGFSPNRSIDCQACPVPEEICNFFQNHPEIYLKYSEIKKVKQELTAKKRAERKTNCSELKDSYVKKAIKKQTGLKYGEITQESIDLKREMLMFHRELKKVKEEIGDGSS